MPSSSRHDNRPHQDTVPLATEAGDFSQRSTILIVITLIGLATTGYFLGLTAPMTAGIEGDLSAPAAESVRPEEQDPDSRAIPAKAYDEMPAVQTAASRQQATRLAMLRQTPYDPNAKITVNVGERIASLADRATRRAYDGAPPTVPHPIDQLDSDSCMACHGEGLRSDSLRAGKMPHPFYADCTQCHVEQNASFATASAKYENTFVGVAAPTNSGNSSPEASRVVPPTTWMREALQNRDPAVDWVPPVVPHTTWMREDCLSCHGRTAAPGMETSHPWLDNCLRCHGELLSGNQPVPGTATEFLPSPAIRNRHE
jgi:cytochrome c-type protein NapB